MSAAKRPVRTTGWAARALSLGSRTDVATVVGRSGVGEARAVAARHVGRQRELAHQQQAATTSCRLRFILPASSEKMRSFSRTSNLSACASVSPLGAHQHQRTCPISPILRPRHHHPGFTHPLDHAQHQIRSFSSSKMRFPRRWAAAGWWRAGRAPALISACSTLVRTAAARPGVQWRA